MTPCSAPWQHRSTAPQCAVDNGRRTQSLLSVAVLTMNMRDVAFWTLLVSGT